MNGNWPASVLMVGCGNMGGAMLAGWIAGGVEPERFTIVDPMLDAAPDGVALLRNVPEARFDAVLLGIKPQMLDAIAPTLAPAVAGAVVLSILAGTRTERLSALFPNADGVVRIMPNMAAAIGKSPLALAERGLSPDRRAALAAFLEPLGLPEWIDEQLFDAVTALAGSGPAFVYRFIDALAEGASALGLDADQASRLALATVEGAALLAASSDHAPAELAHRVASPGGTTAAGLGVLDADQAMVRLMAATLRAARDRGAEMAREAQG